MSVSALPDPMVAPLGDVRRLTAMIHEASGEPLEQTVKRFRQEQKWPGSNVTAAMREWGLPPYVWSDRLAQFYAETDSFLYETAVWNRARMKNRMRLWIGRFLAQHAPGGARVLMYGDGMGFDSAYLAQCGNRVEYWEVSERCIRFARQIFAEAGVTVRVIRDDREIEPQGYDAVVCLDVLEHVPDPPSLVGRLAATLRPGGWMIVCAPFYCVLPGLPTHLKANRTYAGDLERLYAPHGLAPLDGRLIWDPIVLQKQPAGEKGSKARVWPLKLKCGRVLLRAARYTLAPLAITIIPQLVAEVIHRRRLLRRMAAEL